jgi:PhoH-like ATPase
MPRKKLTPVIPSTRLFVLDTNVLLHDPHSTLKFREHDVFVPFVTLEELDGKKAGREDLNRNARQATRLLNDIVMQPGFTMETGFPLNAFNGGSATGNLFVQREALAFLSNEHVRKNDNLYLSVLADLKTKFPGREVVLVTKDLNLRIKARAMDFAAEDFLYDHALQDADLIYRGWRQVTDKQFAQWGPELKSWRAGRVAHYSIPLSGDEQLNEFLVFPDGGLYRMVELRESTAVLQAVEDTTKDKNSVMGICARNEEQRAALSLLQDEDVDLVTLLGPAGTGKTLLALAAAFKQVMAGTYDTILFTRAHTPLGEDIGFLPGSEEEKISPWLGALFDNIEVLAEQAPSVTEGHKLRELAKEVVEVKAMTFMRGRTFHRKFVILDEAQNLTPKQIKALTTRAGEGAKFVVLGNLAQIDSPYLTETSSGLAYLVEKFKGWPHFGSLVLDKGERSRLANAANDRL